METDFRQYTLKELRARENKTQEEKAKDFGVSLATYNAWEKNLSNTKISNLQMIADYYNLRLDQIKLKN